MSTANAWSLVIGAVVVSIVVLIVFVGFVDGWLTRPSWAYRRPRAQQAASAPPAVLAEALDLMTTISYRDNARPLPPEMLAWAYRVANEIRKEMAR